MEEVLSLSTFQPQYAHPPYLNSPRSLEACRRNGVRPSELIEVSFEDFRLAHPGEEDDAIVRRYERLDAARRKTLQSVVEDWKKLCKSAWMPFKDIPLSTGEAIIQVDPSAHSTVLEMQATCFRKIEQQQWNSMQKVLFKEIRDAAEQIRNNEILRKSEVISKIRDNDNSERQKACEAVRREMLEQKRMNEEKKIEEIKISQSRAADELLAKEAEEEEKRRLTQSIKEQKEAERMRRADFARGKKEAMLKKMDESMADRMKHHDLKERENTLRLQALQKRKEVEQAQKRSHMVDRIDTVRKGMQKNADEKTERVLTLREQTEEKIRQRRELEAIEHRRMYDERRELERQKLQRARENSQSVLAESVEKTLLDMEQKEEATQRERARVEDARRRRQRIKQIRYDTFSVTASRRKQAQNNYIEQLAEDLKRKEDRVEAIKQGRAVLSRMRFAIAEGLEQTRSKLKGEVDRLRHEDKLTPQSVVDSMQEASSVILFPSLQRSLGSPSSPSPSRSLNLEQGSMFSSSEGGDRNRDRDGQYRAATAPAVSDKQKRRGHGLHLHPLSQTATLSVASLSSSPLTGPLPLKSLSPESLSHTLQNLTVSVDRALTFSRRSQREDRSRGKSHSSRSGSAGYSSLDHNNLDDYPSSKGGGGGDVAPPVTTTRSNRAKGVLAQARPDDSSDGEVESEGSNNSPENMIERNSSENDSTSFHDNSNQASSLPNDSQESRSNNSIVNHRKNGEGNGENSSRKLSLSNQQKSRRKNYRRNSETSAQEEDDEGESSSSRRLRVTTLVRDRGRNVQTRPDPRTALESLRREQNTALLAVLDEERLAETERERAGRLLGSADVEERRRIELVFSEERRRASDRIISLTRTHEERLRDAVLNMDMNINAI